MKKPKRYKCKSYLIDGGLKYGVEVGDIEYQFPLGKEMVIADEMDAYLKELAEEVLPYIEDVKELNIFYREKGDTTEEDKLIAKLEALKEERADSNDDCIHEQAREDLIPFDEEPPEGLMGL